MLLSEAHTLQTILFLHYGSLNVTGIKIQTTCLSLLSFSFHCVFSLSHFWPSIANINASSMTNETILQPSIQVFCPPQMQNYLILQCLHPHIYKSIRTTCDLHHTKILHLICCNQYDIVSHQTNSSFPSFHYTLMNINYPLNCKSSYRILGQCMAN